MIKHIHFLIVLLVLTSCAKNVDSNVEVYNNDFENNNLQDLTAGTVVSYNGTKVLGTYNNGGFILKLDDLPNHNLIDITFDLYIHDSWEGNQQLQDNAAGPDIWQMIVNGRTYINTTFSNIGCLPGNFCPPQSYPLDYPNNNSNPKSGASQTNLPGYCSQTSNPTGTSLYKIHKTINHSESTLLIQCLDQLKQKNTADPKCDESWSIDNIKINAINIR
jgi:hypothetical protein